MSGRTDRSRRRAIDIRHYFLRGDVIIIGVLAAFAAVLLVLSLLPSGGAQRAVIMVDGTLVAELPLSTDTQYTVSSNGHINIVEISDGRVRMLEADCPDGVCTGQGWISERGEVIVCLPNRVTVTLEGEKNGDRIDAVAY